MLYFAAFGIRANTLMLSDENLSRMLSSSAEADKVSETDGGY